MLPHSPDDPNIADNAGIVATPKPVQGESWIADARRFGIVVSLELFKDSRIEL